MILSHSNSHILIQYPGPYPKGVLLVSHSQVATFLLCGGGKSRVWYNENRNPVQAFTSFQWALIGEAINCKQAMCAPFTLGMVRGVSEVSWDLSLDDGYAPFSCKVSRGIHSVWIVVLLAFISTRRKPSEDLFVIFFWTLRRKIGYLCKNLCCCVTGNSARRSHRLRTATTKSLEPPLGMVNKKIPARLKRIAFHFNLALKNRKAFISLYSTL